MSSARIIVAFAALVTSIIPGLAQDWPTRPVTMVYPFAAGSAADVMGRLFGARLSELLGQPFIFENVGGAGGMIGSNRIAKAAPDGYQFALGGTFMTLNQTLSKKPLYNAATDFAPVLLTVEQPIVLVARKDLPADSLTEFIVYAKGNQAKMQYGSAGVGSMPHLACELFNRAIGINITHVPYRGGGQVVQDLVAGRIDYFCSLAATAIPQIESKTLKAVVILSKNRLPVLPNLASMHEQGFTDFDVNPWYGFFLPRGTPALVVKRLREASVATMATPPVQERLQELGYTLVSPDRQSSEYFQKFVESEIERWAAVIRTVGIPPQ